MEPKAWAGPWIRRLLTAWLAASGLEFLLLPAALRRLEGVEALRHMSLLRLSISAVLALALLLAAERLLLRRGDGRRGRRAAALRWLLPGLFALSAVPALLAGADKGFLAACLAVLGLLTVYALRGWDAAPETAPPAEKPKPVWAWLTALMTLGFFALISLWSVARVRTFSAPSYDFGIFSQMFASMRRTGLPVTTLERSYPLSHFAVHVSPIYYLLLPFYLLVPRPETLQILQAAVMAAAVVPLWKLGGLHGLTGPRRTLLCALLLLAPAFGGGAGFDLHENCFLTVLLLWLFWALEKDSRPVTVLAALLTLCVKEDAAVYVGVIGLWAALRALLRPERRGQLLTGLLLLGGAAAWFLAVTAWLDRAGVGVMTERYRNLDYTGSGSLLTVVQAILLCPMKLLRTCADPEKLPYARMTLGALLGIPVWTRRWERLILLLPWLLVNLVSDYGYQHSILFQYSFGSLACLIYLCCMNMAPRPETARSAAKAPGRRGGLRLAAMLLAAGLSLGFCWKELRPDLWRYLKRWRSDSQVFAERRRVLAEIPREASVTASTFYTVPLSDRTTLYDTGYVQQEQLLRSDYVVLDVRDPLSPYDSAEGAADGPVQFRALLTATGYRVTQRIPGVLEIWRPSGVE